MMVGEADLFAFYKTNFELVKANMFTLTELEDMFPFERHVYVSMLNNYINEKSKGN